MDAVNTDGLRGLLAKYPLPWAYGESYSDSGARYGEITSSREYAFEDVCGEYGMSKEAAELATAAVNALPALLDAHDRLAAVEAELAALRAGMRAAEAKMRAWGDEHVGDTYRLPYHDCADELARLLPDSGEVV